MGTSLTKKAHWQAATLTIAGALARLLPHPPNFTPVGAMSLFAGAKMAGWQGYFLPLAVMLVTDPILSAIHGFPAFSELTPVIYASFLINVWIGQRFLSRSAGPVRILLLTSVCSLKFFLMTNFAVWAFGDGTLYAHTWAGLMACYTLAIPFLGRTLMGDLLFSALLFGLYEFSKKRLQDQEKFPTREN